MPTSLDALRVVLVEPSSSQQKIISRALEAVGIISYDIVTSGAEAYDYAKSEKADLVISAMYLPDMQATDLIVKIRETSNIHDLAFMLISSESSWKALDPLKQAGVTAILPKPFNADQLRTSLYNSLDFLDPGHLSLDDYEIADLNVLVVDDSLMARNHIIRVLKGLGIEKIDKAENGRLAIPLLDKNFYDLIVTDYNMPEMDGRELTEYVRQKSNQSSVPMLMVTSENGAGSLAAVQQAGVSAICDKPFEAATVKELIRTVMSSHA